MAKKSNTSKTSTNATSAKAAKRSQKNLDERSDWAKESLRRQSGKKK